MKINKVGARVVIPTIIILKNFVSFNFWCYEVILYERN